MVYNQVSHQHCNFHTNLKKVLNVLVAKLGYQKPKSGSPSKFYLAWGYRSTTTGCYPVINKTKNQTNLNCMDLAVHRISSHAIYQLLLLGLSMGSCRKFSLL